MAYRGFLFITKSYCDGLSVESYITALIFCRVKFVFPTFRVMKETFCNSTPFFVSRVSFLLNTNIAKTMSGLFLNMHTVAAFDLSQKILSFVSVPIQMLNQAIYPHVAKNPIKSFSVKMLYVIAALSLILSVLLFFSSTLYHSLFFSATIC
ncbi:oligosaccharide flippase family protein [Bacteroides fragilis]